MCDSGPFVFRKKEKCAICGKSPAAKTDEYSDDFTFCKLHALKYYGAKIVREEFEE